MLPDALAPLANYRQFILCKFIPRGNGKTDKLPADHRTLQVFETDSGWQQDPAAWTDYATAEALAANCGDGWGVGFFFTEQDPFYFVDIDNCLQPDGQWSPVSLALCGALPGAAIEISQSGNGLHIFGQYAGPAPAHGCKNKSLSLELYTSKRFVALTGTGATGSAATDSTVALHSVITEYFPPSEEVTPENWRNEPVPEWSGPDDDNVLINKMLSTGSSAKAAFGGGATVADLWRGDEGALGRAYPAINPEHPYDRSSADAALAAHLAFWTGKNHERMERLMRRSALVRDKWEKHKSYMKMTVGGAVNRTENVYSSGGVKAPVEHEPVAPQPTMRAEAYATSGMQFMGVEQIMEHFAGCVYIQDRHRVFTPAGALLKPDQFRATYGGYEFAVTPDNSKTAKNAWEVFTEGQAVRFPRVSSTCFRPEEISGGIINEENQTLLNTYVPIETRRRPGDITRFLNHLRLVLPNERDQQILLSYMAACVQYPGYKFQWCPLIQGGEGNGKTLFMRAVAFAVGNRYTHYPNASDLGNNGSKFTAWIQNKLFIGVEEIYVSDRREVTEALKVLITNDRIEIQGKGADQVTGDNRANFIMCSNHKDALIASIDGRRYSIFYSAQQTADDLRRDGMDGRYFPDLYNWLKFEGGYEFINDYLHTYQIMEEFNPAGACQRAPATTSTQEAVSLSLGSIEQEVLEAVEEGRSGFAGGWISSAAFTRLLEQLKAERKIPPNRRSAILNSLGYYHHPSLNGGRVNAIVPSEGTKPRLFIKQGHILCNLETPGEVLRHYMDAQQYPAGFGESQVVK